MANSCGCNTPGPARSAKEAVQWLYFGYLAYQQAVWMLNNGFFNPANPRIWIPTRAQFWSFLASVVVFADFVYASLQVTDARAARRSS